MFRTGKNEIHIERKEMKKWVITIFTIENAMKELLNQQIVESYDRAYDIAKKYIMNKKIERELV